MAMRSPRTAALALAGVLLAAPAATGADPGSGRLTSPRAEVRWRGTLAAMASPARPELCPAIDCDEFTLEVALPGGTWKRPGGVQIGIRWEDEAQDLDLFVYDGSGALIASSDGAFASTAESVLLENAANGRYRVVVSPRLVDEELAYEGLAEVEFAPRVHPVRELLPNLVSLPSRNFHFATGAYLFDPGMSLTSCYPEEMIEAGARRCMRFDQIIANLGQGPFELRYRMNTIATEPNLIQRIYRSDGTYREREADTYEFHPAHAHFHYENFAFSRLWRSNATGRKLGAEPVVEGDKNGFCMIDVENVWFGRRGDAARNYYFPRCNAPTESDGAATYMVNGISPGWADVYNWFLADQYLEVSGVDDGYYLLETIADPQNTIVESNEGDNVMTMLIKLCGDEVEVVGHARACG
jgi:hypothetical protein